MSSSSSSSFVPIIVGIAGGSGSGKTTLVEKLKSIIGEDYVTYISHDMFYYDLSHIEDMNERSLTNFDHPNSLDTKLFLQCLQQLKLNQSTSIPIYDFANHTRTKDSNILLIPKKIILLDGILLLTNPELTKEMDIKVFVEAEADIRLARRLWRDTQERGRTIEQVLQQYHATVRPMHEEWVEPSKKEADLIIHSSGHSMDVAIEMLTNHLKVKAGLCS